MRPLALLVVRATVIVITAVLLMGSSPSHMNTDTTHQTRLGTSGGHIAPVECAPTRVVHPC